MAKVLTEVVKKHPGIKKLIDNSDRYRHFIEVLQFVPDKRAYRTWFCSLRLYIKRRWRRESHDESGEVLSDHIAGNDRQSRFVQHFAVLVVT